MQPQHNTADKKVSLKEKILLKSIRAAVEAPPRPEPESPGQDGGPSSTDADVSTRAGQGGG